MSITVGRLAPRCGESSTTSSLPYPEIAAFMADLRRQNPRLVKRPLCGAFRSMRAAR
jgi:hypothetical protein